MKLNKVFEFSVFLVLVLSTAADTHWGYPDLDANMDEEFPKWGGICDTGLRQSPINLSQRNALKGDFHNLKFVDYDEQQVGASLVNNGHSIQLSEFSNEMELSGGGLVHDFIVEQIHLHWWSEHTIEGIRYPLEAHIVHRNKNYPNMTMAANFKDGIAVVGVLYHVSTEPNDAIDNILDNLDQIKSYTTLNKPTKMKQAFTVRDLFPTIEGYFTYAGSLTTPSCAESVTWIVLTETFPVTLEQVEQFKEIEYDESKKLRNNYREIQSSNNRAIVIVLGKDVERGAASLPLHFSLASTLLIAFVAKYLH